MGNALVTSSGSRSRSNPTTILPADLAEARDLLLDRASRQGLAPFDWFCGQRKIYLGSLGIDWSHAHNRVVLIDLVRSGYLSFARADMVAFMDRAMVAASEVTDGLSTWHFLVLREVA